VTLSRRTRTPHLRVRLQRAALLHVVHEADDLERGDRNAEQKDRFAENDESVGRHFPSLDDRGRFTNPSDGVDEAP
jgi:hypothetical protein